jgi:hypothetical protein
MCAIANRAGLHARDFVENDCFLSTFHYKNPKKKKKIQNKMLENE